MDSTAAIALSILAYLIVPTTNASPVMTRQKLIQLSRNQLHCSDVVNFNNIFYVLEYRKNITGIPADISVHWSTGNLYFTLVNEHMKMKLHLLRPSGDLEPIKTAGLGQSTAVDNFNDIVYIATDNGVYKYTEDSLTMQSYTASGEDVMYVAVNSDGTTMYIATWPQNKVQKITNDGQKQETFSNIPNGHGLTIDTRNNIYFVASKTSYILKRGETVPIKIYGLPSDKAAGMFVSRSDEVYAMDDNSDLYVIDAENASAKRLGSFDIEGVNAFAMDAADNIVIGIKDAILKFKAHDRNPCPAHPLSNTSVIRYKDSKRRKTTTTTEAIEIYSEEEYYN